MAIPAQGAQFPDFELDGFDSKTARAEKPLLLVLWKTGCSTSRITVPFFDRIQDAYPGATVIGVAQENRQDLDAYVENNGLELRHLADAELKVSRQYGLETVPSYLLTDSSGIVLANGVGWDRKRIESISDRLATMLGVSPRAIVTEEDRMADFTPG